MKVLTWWAHPKISAKYCAIICDGSVRSGKTLCMSLSFVIWAMAKFDGCNFAICGKTVASCKRNVITPLLPALAGTGMTCRQVFSGNYVDVTFNGHTNRFYIFGGKDESSSALIQGITLAGVLLDEVALMPRSFVEQALARCSVTGSRFWFNCNPESPSHWFYLEWIQKAEGKEAIYLHFTMDDNPSLSRDVKRRYEMLYTGTFYERYILGRWVIAQGLVYPSFNRKQHVTSERPRDGLYYVSIDYGTANPTSMGLWCMTSTGAVRIKEYYYSGRDTGKLKTDEEYYSELEKLVDGVSYIEHVIIDPSAASFIECIRRHDRFSVRPANNNVLDGIRTVSTMLKNGMLKIHESCTDAIREFGLYSWDDKATEDKVIKNNDHAMDDIRYFAYTVMRREFRFDDWSAQNGNF